MPTIHPTAIVHPKAELASGVYVGPYCTIDGGVRIDSGTELRSHVSVTGNTVIGQGNVVWPFTCIGADPQDLKYEGEDSRTIVGDHNEIRENVTIHKGTDNDLGQTVIGSHNLIMAYAHIAHDCIIKDHVVITNAVQLAGHVLIEDGAAVGGASAVHHFVTIGTAAFVAGMTRVVHDVPPYMMVEGNPAKVRGVNTIGVRRRQLPPGTGEKLKDAYRRLYRYMEEGGVGETAAALDALEAEYDGCPEVLAVVGSVRQSTAGVHGRYREGLRTDDRYTNPAR
ncbi:MAG: acyl-ACP--UDP-N-acetylglucosamine O-acyltransferase [Planctomycetota bacterium]